MTGGPTIQRADLMQMLQSGSPVDNARPIVERLGALDADELPARAIPTRELQAIYERRRTRMPDAHPLAQWVDRLLAALKNYRGAEVLAVTLESSSGVITVWLSGSGDSVISTLVDHHDG